MNRVFSCSHHLSFFSGSEDRQWACFSVGSQDFDCYHLQCWDYECGCGYWWVWLLIHWLMMMMIDWLMIYSPSSLVLISEYGLYRQGANAVKSWKILNCGSTSTTCSNWQDSASRVISSLAEGEYRYPCDSTTHNIGSIFRFTPLRMQSSSFSSPSSFSSFSLFNQSIK